MQEHSDRHLIAFILFVVVGLASLVLIFREQEFSLGLATAIALITWLGATLYIAFNSRSGWLSLPVGYLLLLGLFHLGRLVPGSMGWIPELEAPWMFSTSASKAMLLCTLAFSSYAALSARAASALQQKPRFQATRKPGTIEEASLPLFLAGIALFLSGAIALYVGAYELNFFQTHYGDTFLQRSVQDPRIFGIGFLFSLMGMVIAAAGASRRQIKVFAAIPISILAPFFFFGFRGHLIVYTLALLMIWRGKDPRLAKRVAVITLVVFCFLAPSVKLLRTYRADSLTDALSRVNVFDIALEAGASALPLVETIETLDYRGESYWYGRSYALAFARIVPNVSLRWSAPNPHSSMPPAAWITRIVSPMKYMQGGGIGYSGIAEPYLNFGPIGVALFFGLVGYLMMRYEGVQIYNVYVSAVVHCSYASLLWTVRNDFTNFTRPCVWSLAYVFGIYMLFGRKAMGDD